MFTIYIYRYTVSGVDFNSAVGCIVRAIEGSIRQSDITCVYVDQSKGLLKLTETEELVSNIVQIKQVEADRILSVFDFQNILYRK